MKHMPAEHQWRKSSHSNGNGGECVEIAELGPVVGVRDSKRPQGPRLAVGTAAWGDFVEALRRGRLR